MIRKPRLPRKAPTGASHFSDVLAAVQAIERHAAQHPAAPWFTTEDLALAAGTDRCARQLAMALNLAGWSRLGQKWANGRKAHAWKPPGSSA